MFVQDIISRKQTEYAPADRKSLTSTRAQREC